MIPLPTLRRTTPVDHSAASAAFVADEPRTDWHDAALWHVREKRDRAAGAVPEWETLRTLAAAIKDHTLSRLDTYLEAFEAAATANGATVHWARDAAEHNRIVHGLLVTRNVRRVVKSKSMLTEECGLNPYLAARGVAVVDTDLGEHIVQLAEEPPSHIVLPAIHKTRGEVGAIFHEHLGTPEGEDDPDRLTAAARTHLRARFLEGEAAVTGANFVVAETGEVVVCTNEGNADLGMHLPPLHIVSVGIEKVIPRRADLAVFLRLLARSATGQALTVYTSHLRRPRPGTEVHIVLVDAGRTEQLARPGFRASLRCIRCAACLNTCPVYRRSGGHSYGATVPGPIGSILTPGLDLHRYAALPFASTLCGSCSAVCPVRIPIDEMLYDWRQVVTDAKAVPWWKRAMLRATGLGLGRPGLHRLGGRLMPALLRRMPAALVRAWTRTRDLPDAPDETFREWARRNRPAQP